MDPTVDALREAFAHDATSAPAYRALVAALEGRNEPRELAETHERWAEHAPDDVSRARAWASAAERREAYGDVDRAFRDFLRAVDLDPRNAVAADGLARLAIELREPHRYVDALTRRAARLRELEATASERALGELALARAHATIPGRLDACFEHHRAAVALDPELETTLDESIERARRARRMQDVRALLATRAETTKDPSRRLEALRALAEARQALPADFDGAIDALESAHALDPDDESHHAALVDALERRAARRKGTDAERVDRARLATLAVERARRVAPELALAALDAVLRDAPDHGPAGALLERLVEEHPTTENLERLVRALERRLAATSSSSAEATRVRRRLGAALDALGRTDAAFTTLLPLLEDPSAPHDLLVEGLRAARRAGRRCEAIRLLRRATSGVPPVHEITTLEELLADALLRDDDAATCEAARRLLELAPNHLAALDALCAWYGRVGDPAALRSVLERRIAATQDTADRRRALMALVTLADGPLGDPDVATDAFRRVAELDPRDRALRDELRRRLAAVGRHRALADVHRWEITHLDALEERKRALDALLALAAAHPFDATELATILRTYRSADPSDPEARAALVAILRGAGELTEAAALLAEAARAARTVDERRDALVALAEMQELGLRDDPGAWASALAVLELGTDAASIDRLERIAERSGRRDLRIEALEHRARSVSADERIPVWRRIATLRETSPSDEAAAIDAYERIHAALPDDAEANEALLRLYESTDRPVDLARLLDELAGRTTDRETRIGLLRRRARLLRDVVRDLEGAADAYRELRTLREDDEALGELIVHARARGLHAELSYLLATRLGRTSSNEESIELGMERATLLLDHLADPREAERELHAIRAIDPTFAPALARLFRLYEDEGDVASLAEVAEAHLAIATQPGQRARLAQRLFEIHVRAIPDAERALVAARAWVAAAPFDLEALRALAERLDPETHAPELVRTYDARADELVRRRLRNADAPDPAMRDEALLSLEESVRLSIERRNDVAHAETRLVRALEVAHDDAADVERFVRLAIELDATSGHDRLRRATATFLARKATTVARPTKESLYLAAADLFGGSLADAGRAFEVARRAIAECTDHPEVLRSLVDYGTAGGFEDELERVLGERFDACVDAATARALMRERAELLHTLGRYGEAADAYHRLASMEPDNDRARVRHRECLLRAERYQDLLITLHQAIRRLGPAPSPERLALLRDVARTVDDGLDDAHEAIDAWRTVLAAAPDDPEARAALERRTGEAGAKGTTSARRSIVPRLASNAPVGTTGSIRPPAPRPLSIPPPPPGRPMADTASDAPSDEDATDA